MPCHPSSFDSLFHDGHRQALELEVQLKPGNAILGAGDFAIHVTEGVLPTHDIREDPVVHDLLVFIEFGANADTDPSAGTFHLDTRIH